jgi:hypothetical protein
MDDTAELQIGAQSMPLKERHGSAIAAKWQGKWPDQALDTIRGAGNAGRHLHLLFGLPGNPENP